MNSEPAKNIANHKQPAEDQNAAATCPASAPAVASSKSHISFELADDLAEQLTIAGQVQRNFLPDHLPQSDKLRWATVFQPAAWVSGDIYDVARLDEEHIGFYIADAVGHSMPAALLTMFLKHAMTMRQTWDDHYRIFTPAEVVMDLNNKMVDQHFAESLFATCCYCLLNTETLELTYTRAGHPYPVLLRKGLPSEQLQTRGGLLGVFENAQFEQRSIQLQPDDKILLYSDGCEPLIGNCNNQSEFVFNSKFQTIAELSVDKMMNELDSLVENSNVSPIEADDVTAIGLEIL